jgi:hypothetical protein
VLEDEADLVRRQPDVDRDEHPARRRNAEVGFEEGGHVGAEECNPIVPL